MTPSGYPSSSRPASDLGPPPSGPGPGGRRVPEAPAPSPGPAPGAYRRPRTADRRVDGATRATVQRRCNGCGQAIGDVTDAEMAAAVAGTPLPDVTAECPFCTPDPDVALAELRTSYEAMTALAWDAIAELRSHGHGAQLAALALGRRFRALNDQPCRQGPVSMRPLIADQEAR